LTTTGQPAAKAEAVSPPATEKASENCSRKKRPATPAGAARAGDPASARTCAPAGRCRSRIDPRAFLDQFCKHFELVGGAGALTTEAVRIQGRLLVTDLDEFVAKGIHLGCDLAQELPAASPTRGSKTGRSIQRGPGDGSAA